VKIDMKIDKNRQKRINEKLVGLMPASTIMNDEQRN